MMRKRILFTAVAAVLLITAALAGATAFAGPAPADNTGKRTVSVSGSAQVALKPDVANVTFGTLTRDADAAKARQANDTLMAAVMAAIKAQGVDTDKDVKTVNYSINPTYEQGDRQISGYEINNSIQVKVRDLKKLGAIMDAAAAAGANLAGNLSFDVENRQAAYQQALKLAIADAKTRAETLAKSAGATLGAAVSASESGGNNPYPVYYAGDMRSAGVPVSAGTLQVNATVSVTFELN